MWIRPNSKPYRTRRAAPIDLRALAWKAALEVDNLVLRRSGALDAVKKVAQHLGEGALSSRDVVVFRRVLAAVSDQVPAKREELKVSTESMRKKLLELVGDPVPFTTPERVRDLESLRLFLLSLAKVVAASERVRDIEDAAARQG